MIEMEKTIVKSVKEEYPWEIERNIKFSPYFQHVIGALDGTHIPAHVPATLATSFQNLKGYISQNFLLACSFNTIYTYVLPERKGSAHDGRVMSSAMRKGFEISDGKSYLADTGYALRKGCWTLYIIVIVTI